MIPWKVASLGRRRYWTWIGILVGLKLVITVAINAAPQSLTALSHFDTAIVLGVAVTVGARFVDIGWPRWLGIGGVLLIMLVFPIFLVMTAPSRSEGNELNWILDKAWMSTVALLALLVATGLKRGASDVRPVHSGAPLE